MNKPTWISSCGRATCVAIVTFALQACVTSPRNGSEVASTSTAVTFDGVGLAPLRRVTVEASSSAAGPFVTIPGASAYTALKSTRSITLRRGTEVPLYKFTLASAIPAARWHTLGGSGRCSGGAETFIRIREGAALYRTFDEKSHGLDCIEAELDAGHSADAALATCSSHESPVLRLTTGTSKHVGDVVIDDAADIAALECVEEIDGNLSVTATAPYLVSLPNLKKVTGDVSLLYTSYAPDPHPPSSSYEGMRCGSLQFVTAEVRIFDMPLFAQVGGNLTLHQTGSFSGSASTQPIDLELNALTSVGGDLTVEVEQFGASPCGLTLLPSVPGDVTVIFHAGEVGSVVSGLMPAVTDIGGRLTLDGGHNSFGNPLGALTNAGALTITKSPGLSGFHLTSLTNVTGDVVLSGLGIGSNPSSLTQVGSLTVTNSTYSSLEQVGGATLATDGLNLHDNLAFSLLTNAGASKLTLTPTANLTIIDNPTLPSAEVCNFVAIQTAKGWSGPSALSTICP